MLIPRICGSVLIAPWISALPDPLKTSPRAFSLTRCQILSRNESFIAVILVHLRGAPRYPIVVCRGESCQVQLGIHHGRQQTA